MMCTLLLLSCQLLASGAAAAPAAADVSSSPSALPQRRLIVNGSTISDPRTPTVPLKLRGFNFWIDLSSGVEPEDRAVSSILPGTNFARLVMVHWQDTANGTDCYDAAGTPSTGYLRTECLTMFDDAIKWSTGAGLWTVLTARAKGAGAAGSTPSSTAGILNSPKLTAEMVAMWSFLAARYASTPGIAGYEVLSEPQSLNATKTHAFHVATCNAVWAHDPRAACFIGAGAYYDRYNLDERYILSGQGPVIYAANYLTPKPYTKGELLNISYPMTQKMRCGDLVMKKDQPACPGGDMDAEIVFNKDFLRKLAAPFTAFSEKYDVPLWVDQWGVHAAVGGGNASASAYLTDALDIFEQGGFPWTQWIWRGETSDCQTYNVICQPVRMHAMDATQVACGAYHAQMPMVRPLRKYLGGVGPVTPIIPPKSTVCACIERAESYCAEVSKAGCRDCIWQHKSQLSMLCDWNDEHSKIVSGVCGGET